MRRAHNIYSHFLVPRRTTPPSSVVSSTRLTGEQKLLSAALYSSVTAFDLSRWCSSLRFPVASPSIASKSIKNGVAGALSFSFALSTAVEAKEPPSPEFLPKDVVLYQYEACPFCNKVKD